MLNWTKLGRELRQSAMDAHNGELPDVRLAYAFLLDNPECFIDADILHEINGLFNAGCGCLTMADVEIGNVDWPMEMDGGFMPADPNIELIAAYYDTDHHAILDAERAIRPCI